MKMVRFGKTGLEVSRVGIGGIPIQRPSENAAIKVIQRAIDLGVNFIDTSIGYGDSEVRIGKAIAEYREDVIIATKGTWRNKEDAAKHIDHSLDRLQTEYIDIWQFHNISTLEGYDSVIDVGGSMEAAQEALAAGKIHHIGFSTHSLDVALKGVSSGMFETVQFPLNFISSEAVDELVPSARENDVGFIGMKPFAGGHISNANLAIKYVLQYENVVPDPGIQSIDEIEEIVDIVDGSWEFTDEEKQLIGELREKLDTRFCRQCGYCLPCAQGVEIPMILIAHGMWKLWPEKLFKSEDWWYPKVMETAQNCIKCSECEDKCPYHLPIPEMITENYEFHHQRLREV